jgi:hypothetical protein
MIMKAGPFYSGRLVAASAEKLVVVHIDGYRPAEYDTRKVRAVQTRDGVFAFSERTGAFERAVTYYRLNPSAGQFERLDQDHDPFACEDAFIEGPENVRALRTTLAGALVLGLPMPPGQGPSAIPAYHLQTVTTSKGVYTWSEGKRDYEYKSHPQIAAEIQAARDKYWAAVDEKTYRRRMERYEAATRRIQAIARAWGWRWWW